MALNCRFVDTQLPQGIAQSGALRSQSPLAAGSGGGGEEFLPALLAACLNVLKRAPQESMRWKEGGESECKGRLQPSL